MQHIFLPGSTDHFVQGKYSFETHSALFPDTWDQHTCSNGCLVSCYHLGVPQIGVPQNEWFLMENLIQMGGTPILGNRQWIWRHVKETIFADPRRLDKRQLFFFAERHAAEVGSGDNSFATQVVRKLWLERFIREDRWTMDTHGHA